MESIGPGHYKPQDHLTKVSSQAVDFKKSKGRDDPETTDNIGPGHYEIGTEFGESVKNMTIGQRRE